MNIDHSIMKNIVMRYSTSYNLETIYELADEIKGNFINVVRTPNADIASGKINNEIFNTDMDNDHSEISYLSLLKQYKIHKAYKIDHQIPNIINKKNGQILSLQLGEAKIELAIPYDIQVLCVDNSAYVYISSEDEEKDRLYLEIHGSVMDDICAVIDYDTNTGYVMRNNNIIIDMEYYKSPELITRFSSEFFDVKNQIEDEIVSDTCASSENNKINFFGYRIDILNDNQKVEKIIGITPIPFIIGLDNILYFTEDHNLYRMFIIEKDDNEKDELVYNYYTSLTPEDAKYVDNFWKDLLKNSESV